MENNINTASYDGTASFLFFLAFLRYKIDQDRAKQINIARAIEVRPEYINRVYKGRQTCSVDVQEKICRFFGISYLEALAIGRQLVQTGKIPSGKSTPPDSSPPLPVEKNRRLADRVSEGDVVSIVSQWVVHKKETEETLAKLQNILENLSEGLVILDINLIIEYQNRAHREMFGASLVGQTCYTAHGCEKFVRDYPSLVSRRTGMPASGFIPSPKGTVSVLTSPIRDMSGQITGYVEMLRDITEREKLFLMTVQALEMMDRAVIVVDENRYIRLATAKLKEITGAEENDLLSTETFLSYLRKNRVCLNLDEVVAGFERVEKEENEESIRINFSNGTTYLYTVRLMYSRNVYIGRVGVFVGGDQG